MKKAIRITTSILLIVIGVGTVGLSTYALLHVRDLTMAAPLLSVLLLGIAMVFAGLAIARGESVRDLLRDLLSAAYI